MLPGFLILLLLQAGGDMLSQYFRLPIPGHVIGMIALWTWLSMRGERPIPETLNKAVSPLLKHLAFFFVPLNIGILQYADVFEREGYAIGWAMAIGLVVPLLCTAGFLEWWFSKSDKKNQKVTSV